MKVKICGVLRAADIRAAIDSGANAVGLNFVAASPRFVGGTAEARRLMDAAGARGQIAAAGVFVNAQFDSVLAAAKTAGLEIIQLHGDESPAYAEQLKNELGPNVQVWRAFRIAEAADLRGVEDFPCDAIVLDAKAPGARGGTGHAFDWTLLQGLRRDRTLVLAGGLTPENVRLAVRSVRPDWVDTASGVESVPGIKDHTRISRFVQESRA